MVSEIALGSILDGVTSKATENAEAAPVHAKSHWIGVTSTLKATPNNCKEQIAKDRGWKGQANETVIKQQLRAESERCDASLAVSAGDSSSPPYWAASPCKSALTGTAASANASRNILPAPTVRRSAWSPIAAFTWSNGREPW
jgi:hypothetical protein